MTVVVNNKDKYYTNINGIAKVDIENLKDDDEFEIIYSGNENYAKKDKNTTNALLNSKIVAVDMIRGVNSEFDYQAILHDKNDNAISNATVTFTIGGKNYTAVSDVNGIARIKQQLGVGSYNILISNPFNKEDCKQFVW